MEVGDEARARARAALISSSLAIIFRMLESTRCTVKRTVTAGEARQRLGDLLNGVFYRGDEVAITRGGKTMGVVVTAERYESMSRSREELFDLIERIQTRNAGTPPEVIEREVAEAVKEVRALQRRKREKD